METPVQVPKPASGGSSHPYPMVRSGGLFLLFVGAGVVGGTFAAGDRLVNAQIFFEGLGAAVLSLFAARWVSFGRGTRLQLTALFGALGLQAILLVAAATVIGPMPEDRLWYRTMIVVGLHFLPMAIVFGPRMLLLGTACIVNATIGFVAPVVPFALISVVDGLLKVGFGVWMLSDQKDAARPIR
jgi:uncharacterized protein DUF6609